MYQYHYTDADGYKAVQSQPDWIFKASQPPSGHPVGAYFTTLGPETPKLANRLRIPKAKIGFVFCFDDQGDLTPLRGGRGEFIFYSPSDYTVSGERQVAEGSRESVTEKLS